MGLLKPKLFIMIESQGYYESLSDESLEARFNFDYKNRARFKRLGQDLSEDIIFMRNELRKRKLARLDFIEYTDKKDEIEKLDAPIDFVSLLLDCNSENEPAEVVKKVKYIHAIDPFWEEDWFELDL